MQTLLRSDLMRKLLLLLVLVSFLGLSPQSHLARRNLEAAWRAMERGHTQEASEQLAAAASRLPGRNDLWEQAGHYALKARNAQAAVEYLEAARQPAGLSVQASMDLGDAYQQTGDLASAVAAWQDALPAQEYAADLYRRLWQAHRTLGDTPAAIADLQTLAGLQPTDAQVRYQLGLLSATREPEAALAYLVQAAELDPTLTASVETVKSKIQSARISGDPAYSLLSAGQALASLGEWELAVEAFQQATLSRPDYAEAWAFLGEARQHVAEAASVAEEASEAASVSKALTDLEKALELDPKSLSANIFLSLYWTRQERFDLAREALEEAAGQDPRNPILQVETGNVLATLGDLEAALEAYRKAVALAPRDSAYLRFLAGFSLKYEYQVRENALPAARSAVLLSPVDPANLDVMAQVLIKLNDQLNAERFLNRAIQTDSDYAPAHLHLGLLYLLREENERAYQELNLARSLDPGSPASDQSLRLLQTYFP